MFRGPLRATVWLTLAAAATLVAPGSALAVAPAKGQSYYGNISRDLDPLLEVEEAGKRLSDYRLGGVVPCSDGTKRFLGLNATDEPPTAIGPDGSFSYASKPSRSTIDIDQERSTTGTQQTSFSGTFSTIDKATVTVTSTFRSSRFQCSGTATLTLGRAGSAGAPFRNARVATGRYRIRGAGLKIPLLVAFAPLQSLERLTFSARVPCSNGSSYRTTFDLPPAFRIDRRGIVRVAGGSASLGGGDQKQGTFRVIAAFSRTNGVYRVRGKIRLRGVVTRRGKRVTSCSTLRSFSGRFVSGPKNLF